jgi:hypothetical protein
VTRFRTAGDVLLNPTVSIAYVNFNGDGAMGEAFLILEGNESVFNIGFRKVTNGGIVDIYNNGILQIAGVDLYAAANADYIVNLTNVSLEAGRNTVKFVINGKNGASSGYNAAIYRVSAQKP